MKYLFSIFLFLNILVCQENKNKEKEKIPRIIEQMIEQRSNIELNLYSAFKSPTYPLNIKKIFTEWTKTKYLVICFLNEIAINEELQKIYIKIIENTIRITNVLILVDKDDCTTINELICLLKKNDLDIENQQYQIKIMSLGLDTKWVRDYAPVFAINEDNNLCVIDAIYRDIRIQDSSIVREKDDVSPVYLANYLFKDISIVKPPFQLWGGDFYSDGSGNIFTSIETLIMNGGDRNKINTLFQYYYGAKKIIYLTPLPGNTIKHIDMFFKIVNENTILIGEYNENTILIGGRKVNLQDNSYQYFKFIQKEAKKILEANYTELQEKFPEKKIIKLPMPPIDFEIDKDAKLSYENLLKTIENKMLSLYDDGKFLEALALEKILQEHKQKIVYELYHTIYKTYLNSIFIEGKGGKLLLIPSYEGLSKIENEVKKKYEEAYPGARIVFINCDGIIKQFGAIHCITLLIPDIEDIKTKIDSHPNRNYPSPPPLPTRKGS